MEIRKVQLTGGSSFIVTLPKAWVKQFNIQKNDALALVTQNDGSLLVTPRSHMDSSLKTREINVDNLKNPTYLFRMLVGAYVTGLSTIEVSSKKRIPHSFRDTVTRFNKIAVGVEIIEETPKKMVIRDLLSPAKMPFDKTVKRMYNIVKVMHEDAITALVKKDLVLANDVIERDDEVNRLHWLIYRQFSMLSMDPMRFKKIGVTQEDAAYYFLLGSTLERIGDHACILAKKVSTLVDNGENEDMTKAIVAASATALGVLTRGIDAWFSKDLNAANDNVDSLDKLYPALDRINRLAVDSGRMPCVELCYVIESIKRTGEYACNISEFVIDKVLSE
ncbi:phosphate uptake regulator PhoU [archaeon]|nr:phosphate uptake regulator PhoU [archaeon]